MIERRGALFWLGCGLLAGFAVIALSASHLAAHDPMLVSGKPLDPASASHPLGTNHLGQDVLSQLLYGTRTSVIVAGLVTAFSTTLSWLVGLASGFCRHAERPLMAVTDLLLALPGIPLYVLVLTLLEPSRNNLIAALTLLSWPAFARIVRSVVLEARSAAYVEAAAALGATPLHIIWRHLLPATLAILPAKLVLTVRFAVFGEATLAFLGLGSTDALSWGRMLNAAFSDPLLFSRPEWPWLVLPPTIAIMFLLVATVWVSDRPAR
jgi:ABC-type dipeptide/oligopeptide/nickel transport system permease subunit